MLINKSNTWVIQKFCNILVTWDTIRQLVIVTLMNHTELWDTELAWYAQSATVVYWPPTRANMPFQRRRKCIFHWRGRAWLTIWDRVKIPRYSQKLMHRKRVTCELHSSYFRSMTIKYAIPKTAEVHIPMASYGEILNGRSTITQCTGNLRSFGDKTSWQ